MTTTAREGTDGVPFDDALGMLTCELEPWDTTFRDERSRGIFRFLGHAY